MSNLTIDDARKTYVSLFGKNPINCFRDTPRCEARLDAKEDQEDTK
jgi:hypothetical protein